MQANSEAQEVRGNDRRRRPPQISQPMLLLSLTMDGPEARAMGQNGRPREATLNPSRIVPENHSSQASLPVVVASAAGPGVEVSMSKTSEAAGLVVSVGGERQQ